MASDEKIVKEIFKLDESIRYCSIVKDGNVLAGGMKKGVKSLEPASVDAKLMMLVSILLGTDEEWDEHLGKTDYILIRKKKLNIILYRMKDHKGAFVSTDKPLSIPKMDEIRKAIDVHEA